MKRNEIHLVWILHTLRRNLRAPDLQDLRCKGHGHDTDDKLVTLRLKSPAIRPFVQQLVQSYDQEPSKIRITDPARIISLMNCALTKGHYCRKHIQVMTSLWCQLILAHMWKPTVNSAWLTVMRITKHGFRVSLCKASTFSIALNLHEPRVKRTNFDTYIPEITELIDHGSFNHCTNSFHLLRQYWSTSSKDLNSVTRKM